MPVFTKVLKAITRVFLYISYIAIFIMVVMTVVDVVRRSLLGMTMNGVTEFSQMLLIVSMTAMAYALVDGRFIAVSVLVDTFPKTLNLCIEVLMGILSLGFFFLTGVQFIGQIGSSITFGESYFMIGVPKWPMHLALGASFFSCSLATIVYVYERIRNYRNSGEKTVFDENPDLAILAFSDDDNLDAGGTE